MVIYILFNFIIYFYNSAHKHVTKSIHHARLIHVAVECNSSIETSSGDIHPSGEGGKPAAKSWDRLRPALCPWPSKTHRKAVKEKVKGKRKKEKVKGRAKSSFLEEQGGYGDVPAPCINRKPLKGERRNAKGSTSISRPSCILIYLSCGAPIKLAVGFQLFFVCMDGWMQSPVVMVTELVEVMCSMAGRGDLCCRRLIWESLRRWRFEI